MSNYEVGGVYYLPVVVGGIRLNNSEDYPVEFQYRPSSDFMMVGYVADDPGILLTAEEIAQNHQSIEFADRLVEKLDYYEARIKKLEAENGKLNETIADRTKDVQHLTEANEALTKECDDLCEKNNELTDMYNSAKAEMAHMSADYAKLEKKYNKAQEDHEHQEEFWQRDVDSAYSQADKYEERLKQANIKNGNLTEECYRLRRTEKVQRTVIEVLAERVIYLEASVDD